MNPLLNDSYIYLHTNGNLIVKNKFVVETNTGGAAEYFNSPMVVQWWKIDGIPLLSTIRKFVRSYVMEHYQGVSDLLINNDKILDGLVEEYAKNSQSS